jgi:ubiquinone/menaquinone biosynthesis C-methylase UbiE
VTIGSHGGREIDLLIDYPKPKRNLEERSQKKNPKDVKIARQFGKEFFDGPKSQGYGGYRDWTRWVPVAKRIIGYYDLTPGMEILDVGCAKGFALYGFLQVLPNLKVAGIDVSDYAIENAPESVKPFLRVADAKALPFPDNSFDFVISINTVHNLDLEECKEAIREIERVKRKYAFITVDAFHNEEEERRMRMWNLTALTILSVDDWKNLFREVGYTGDYYWFIP